MHDTVIAPLSSLIRFYQPPYGIPCILEDFTNVPVKRWKLIIEASWLTLDIGQLQNGSYPANFAGNSADGKVATSLRRIQGERRLLELLGSSSSSSSSRRSALRCG
jgi:hypothetical protein